MRRPFLATENRRQDGHDGEAIGKAMAHTNKPRVGGACCNHRLSFQPSVQAHPFHVRRPGFDQGPAEFMQ
jgi:hypothetical protein